MATGKKQSDGTWINPPTGCLEESLEWFRVDNGSRKKAEHWRHAYLKDERDPQGRQVCGGKLRRGGHERNVYYDDDGTEKRRRCVVFQGLFPSGRCWRHGGSSPSAGVVHGRYMQSPAGPLGRAEERVKNERNLLDLRPTIALFDERLSELSQRIEAEGDTPNFRVIALRLFNEWQIAEKDKDLKLAQHFKKELKLLLERGTRADKAWTELLNTAERRGKRAEKAGQIAIKGAEVISKSEMTWFIARTLDIISEEAHGTAVARIQSRVAREVLGRIEPTPIGQEAQKAGAALPRVQGERIGVPERDPRGEALEISTASNGEPLPEREVFCEDEPRGGEDESCRIDSVDFLDDEGGLDSDIDSSDRSSGEEPPVGGDREDAREGEAGTPGESGPEAT